MKYITCLPNKGARVGHQFVEWLLCYNFSKIKNIKFIHTPFLENSKDLDIYLGLDLNDRLPNFPFRPILSQLPHRRRVKMQKGT